MLTHSFDINAARLANFSEPCGSHDHPHWEETRLLRVDDSRFENKRLPRGGGCEQLCDRGTHNAGHHALEIFPAHAVSRQTIAWDGIAVEIVRCVAHDRVEFRFRAPCHLLLVHEEGVRDHGETVVRNLPPSKLRTLKRKLTFVPAGHEYQDWQQPRVPSRMTCFYLDPARLPIYAIDADLPAAQLAPRLFFEHRGLWDAAAKLTAAIDRGCENERYCEALAVIVAHELMQSHGHHPRREPLARGGLAVWQQRAVTRYIEEHLAEPISLAALAGLARLSSYYFCRAFKQSFGMPPHRYHINRRIERAKALLGDPGRSVTDIGLALGFSETSSFSAAFRQMTGNTPSQYRRSLG
ncbi:MULTISPECIES: helix-turn-helix transcriptional regulator [unclassified Bradyrhizobium]